MSNRPVAVFKYTLPLAPLCVLAFFGLLIANACGAGLPWLDVFMPLIVLAGLWVLFWIGVICLLILAVIVALFSK